MNTAVLSQPVKSPRDIHRFVLQHDFYTFFRRAFKTLHPAGQLIDNWHIEAVCLEVKQFLEDGNLLISTRN